MRPGGCRDQAQTCGNFRISKQQLHKRIPGALPSSAGRPDTRSERLVRKFYITRTAVSTFFACRCCGLYTHSMTAEVPRTTQLEQAPAAWSLYFPAEEYASHDRRAQLVKELADYFCRPSARHKLLTATAVTTAGSWVVSLSFDQLLAACGSGDLEAAMECQPLEALCCLGAAAHQVSKCLCWSRVRPTVAAPSSTCT